VVVDGKEHPVLTVWKVGKGRVALLSVRSTWRWSMLSGKKEMIRLPIKNSGKTWFFG